MIDGLHAEHVKVDMGVFGMVSLIEGTCFGCAATNALCQMTGARFHGREIEGNIYRSRVYRLDADFLFHLEHAYDYLRSGNIHDANYYLRTNAMSQLPLPKNTLPFLSTQNYLEHLPAYQAYADYCRSLEEPVGTLPADNTLSRNDAQDKQ